MLQGLRRLEYRGYDSAGIVVLDKKAHRVRAVGKIDSLAEKLKGKEMNGTIGIAHTRWATHGGVTEENAHPHFACDEKLVIVHNGIIENYRELKERLKDKHVFKSETDTEVLAHLIETHYHGDLRKAVEVALKHVRGTYGLVAMHTDEPDKLVAARLGSPLVVGIGENEYFIASDATPILAYTKKVSYLNDGEVAEISRTGFQTYNLKDEQVTKCVEEIEWDDEHAQKNGYPHFMLKEIFDQPTVLEDAIRGRMNLEDGTAHLGGLNMSEEKMRGINRIILIACGTASYAAMVGKYAFERLAGIATEVDVASEFRYRDPVIDEHTLVFAISQSGETIDTLAAVREAKRRGAFVRGIVNVIGSTIARDSAGTYHAGHMLSLHQAHEYGVIMILYALQFGRLRHTTLATADYWFALEIRKR